MIKYLTRKLQEIKEDLAIVAVICFTLAYLLFELGMVMYKADMLRYVDCPSLYDSSLFLDAYITMTLAALSLCIGVASMIYNCKGKDKVDILEDYGMYGIVASIVIFFIYFFCSVAEFDNFSRLLKPIVIGLICIFIAYLGDKLNKPKREANRQQFEKELEQIILSSKKKYEEILSQFYSSFGNPTIDLCFHEDHHVDSNFMSREKYYSKRIKFNSIFVWEGQKLFLILPSYPDDNYKPLHFKDLKSCYIIDNWTETMGDAISVSKTNSKNMLYRGALGGAVFGGTGAIIGAATANKETTTQFEPNQKDHDYSLVLQLDDFSMPSITLRFGKNEMQMRKVYDILHVIINRS